MHLKDAASALDCKITQDTILLSADLNNGGEEGWYLEESVDTVESFMERVDEISGADVVEDVGERVAVAGLHLFRVQSVAVDPRT